MAVLVKWRIYTPPPIKDQETNTGGTRVFIAMQWSRLQLLTCNEVWRSGYEATWSQTTDERQQAVPTFELKFLDVFMGREDPIEIYIYIIVCFCFKLGFVGVMGGILFNSYLFLYIYLIHLFWL